MAKVAHALDSYEIDSYEIPLKQCSNNQTNHGAHSNIVISVSLHIQEHEQLWP